ncbi:FecR family protein [Herbaspirillum camelliae]|uniref:FecR family protein n=1 Tax=Herbaspirillum camelliae TaxID=1892903 RepID=UPI00094A0C35|nr:DUF4880 domain-containing protein [Herbaspirillum camelliae]
MSVDSGKGSMRMKGDAAGRAAVSWMVLMTSNEMTEIQRLEFEAWLKADQSNMLAWQRISSGLQPFGIVSRTGIGAKAVSQVSDIPSRRRRTLMRGGLGVLVAAAGGAAVVQRFLPLDQMLSDHYTKTAEQSRFALFDGTRVTLAPRSAINVMLQPTQRRVDLLQGLMMVEVDANDSRPFAAKVDDLVLSAATGTFMLDRRPDGLVIVGVKGYGSLAGRGVGSIGVSPGSRFLFDQNGLTASIVDASAAVSWTTGWAIVHNESIDRIVEQIRPYFAGIIRVSPMAGQRHASGLFNLYDPIGSLHMMARSVGLSMKQASGFWVHLGI